MSYLRAATPGHATLRLPTSVRRTAGMLAVLATSLAGVGIAAYLTLVHYAGVPLACSTTLVIDCARVTSSVYSVVPGTAIPITIPGIGWFVVSGALALAVLASLWNGQPDSHNVRVAHLIWSGVGLVVALYLVYVELVKLHRICAWCTVVHLLILLTFLITLYRIEALPAPPHGRRQSSSNSSA